MKKFINGVAIVLFLAPLFAMASVTGPTPSSGSSTNVDLAVSCDGFGWFLFDASGVSVDGNVCGALPNPYNIFTQLGDTAPGTYRFVETSSGAVACVPPNTYASCVGSGHITGEGDYVVSSPPPPPPPPEGIDAAVGVATSSFAGTFGFDMDGVASWMWDNLGQPILGSGIGVLYVMRFYWLGFIAISIITLFAFAYFRFFKK